MRRLLLAAVGLALLVPAGLSQAAWAQTAPAPGAPPAVAGQPGGPARWAAPACPRRRPAVRAAPAAAPA